MQPFIVDETSRALFVTKRCKITCPGGGIVLRPPGPACPVTQTDPGIVRRWSAQDHVTGETTCCTEGVGGLFGEGVLRFDEIGSSISHSLKRTLKIRDDDPLSAHDHLAQSCEIGRPGWHIRIESVTEMRSDLTRFVITGQLCALENGIEVAAHRRDETIPRAMRIQVDPPKDGRSSRVVHHHASTFAAGAATAWNVPAMQARHCRQHD